MKQLNIGEGWYQVMIFNGQWDFAYFDELYFTSEFGPIVKIKHKGRVISLEEVCED